jgi:hypothetical protein
MAKQSKLPGFTELEDDEVEAAAEAFATVRDEWQAKGIEMRTKKEELRKLIDKNKKIVTAAKENPKGRVKVGDCLLTIRAKNPTTDVKVKLFGDDEGEGDSE